MPTKKGTPTLLTLKRRLRSNQTLAEQRLWAKLRTHHIHGLKFRRQHEIGSYIVDFFCPERSLVIEVDGDVHATETQQTKDLKREDYLKSLGLQVVRYTNNDVIKNLDGVLEDLSQRVLQNSTSPSPSLQMRGRFDNDATPKPSPTAASVTPALLTKEGKTRKLQKANSIDAEQYHNNVTPNPLPRKFYERPTLKIAKDLLGKVLITQTSSVILQSKIVDVEAYVGPKDQACHASKGRTKRTAIMFGPAGFTYVYLIYGMYHCLNFVTEREDYPAAILIRGLEILRKDHPAVSPIRIDGPGRICRYLGVDRTYNGLDATLGMTLWIEDHGLAISRKQIQSLPRIGVDYAGEWAQKLWRFSLPAVSSPKNRRSKPK